MYSHEWGSYLYTLFGHFNMEVVLASSGHSSNCILLTLFFSLRGAASSDQTKLLIFFLTSIRRGVVLALTVVGLCVLNVELYTITILKLWLVPWITTLSTKLCISGFSLITPDTSSLPIFSRMWRFHCSTLLIGFGAGSLCCLFFLEWWKWVCNFYHRACLWWAVADQSQLKLMKLSEFHCLEL